MKSKNTMTLYGKNDELLGYIEGNKTELIAFLESETPLFIHVGGGRHVRKSSVESYVIE